MTEPHLTKVVRIGNGKELNVFVTEYGAAYTKEHLRKDGQPNGAHSPDGRVWSPSEVYGPYESSLMPLVEEREIRAQAVREQIAAINAAHSEAVQRLLAIYKET